MQEKQKGDKASPGRSLHEQKMGRELEYLPLFSQFAAGIKYIKEGIRIQRASRDLNTKKELSLKADKGARNNV